MTEKVTKVAFASRVIVLLLQFLSNNLIPDYNPDVFRAPSKSYLLSFEEPTDNINAADSTAYNVSFLDKTINFCLRGLRHWDGEYYLHIAEHSYSYENTLAFFPLFPMVVRLSAHFLNSLGLLIGLSVSLRSWTLLVAVAINIYCFCRAASCLYELTQRIFGDSSKSWNAALLFCFNPASIFFSAAYSEALFCWLSLQLMLECATKMRLSRMAGILALTILTRSNGLVNVGFPIYFSLRAYLVHPTASTKVFLRRCLVVLFAAALSLTVFYFYAFQQFCLSENSIPHAPEVVAYGRARNYILAGSRDPQNSPWCEYSFPFPYSYVQSHYWKVGFLRYYEFKQLPNFLLAFPVLAFVISKCFQYIVTISFSLHPSIRIFHLLDDYKSFPFLVHALFLSIFCIFYVHIQISTRMLCSSSPCLYWFAADYLPKNWLTTKMGAWTDAVCIGFLLYCVVGAILFSNNVPWT